MPEWEDMAAVATAVQNLHIMATALGLAGAIFATMFLSLSAIFCHNLPYAATCGTS